MLPLPLLELLDIAEAPARILLAGASALVLIEVGIAFAALIASIGRDDRRVGKRGGS